MHKLTRSSIWLLVTVATIGTAQGTGFEQATGLRPGYLGCYQRADLACVRDEAQEQSQRLHDLQHRWREASLSPRERQARESDHAHWLAMRDAYCANIARDEGGNDPPLAQADCLASANASRTLALRRMIEANASVTAPDAVRPIRVPRL